MSVPVDQARRLREAHSIAPGDRLLVRTADDDWVPAVANSALEPIYGVREGRYRKVHDFPVVWVRFVDSTQPAPWPAEDVQRACPCDGYVYIGPGDPYCDGCAHLDEDHDGEICVGGLP